MLTVKIVINGDPVTLRTAVNISEKRGLSYRKGKQIYRVEDLRQGDSWELEHNYSQGANALARKMLKKPTAGRRKNERRLQD